MRRLNILVVDDAEDLANSFVEVLRLEDYVAEVAYSGEQALEACKISAFDLCIMDNKMPGKDGIEIAKEMKSLYPKLTIILMTGYAPIKADEIAKIHGIISVMQKPINIEKLLEYIKTI